MYKIPDKKLRLEEIIKGSRFITTVCHAPDEKEAKSFISEIKSEFSDATHNCWAYVAGPPGDTGRVGMSDDGEPHGTAGKPMLNVLLHSDIGEIAVVVTRYFGGTKLGTGGLVRAYSGCVKNTIEKLSLKEKRDMIKFLFSLDYSYLNGIKQKIQDMEGEILNEKYEADVTLEITIPESNGDNFIRSVTDLTSGQIIFKNCQDKSDRSDP